MTRKERIDSRFAVFHVRLVRTKGGYLLMGPAPIGEDYAMFSQVTGIRRLSDLPKDEWVRRGAQFARLACPELCGHLLDGV